jgi:DNA-binding NarL/FixJ family response regulator
LVRVVLADPHPLTLVGLRVALAESAFEIVGEALTGAALAPMVRQRGAELVLLELDLPERDGLECLKLLRSRERELRLLVYASCDSALEIEKALNAGADGFITKTIVPGELLTAIDAILAGNRTVFGPCRHDIDFASRAREFGLTRREHEILQLVARGETNRAIGHTLFLTEQTIKFHLTNIYRKTGSANRIEVSRFAMTQGLVEAPSVIHPVRNEGLVNASGKPLAATRLLRPRATTAVRPMRPAVAALGQASVPA